MSDADIVALVAAHVEGYYIDQKTVPQCSVRA
jgi:hypothetical protein